MAFNRHSEDSGESHGYSLRIYQGSLFLLAPAGKGSLPELSAVTGHDREFHPAGRYSPHCWGEGHCRYRNMSLGSQKRSDSYHGFLIVAIVNPWQDQWLSLFLWMSTVEATGSPGSASVTWAWSSPSPSETCSPGVDQGGVWFLCFLSDLNCWVLEC